MMLTFAARPSALARWQTQWVIAVLQAAYPGLVCVQHVIATRGDRTLDNPLPEMGGKGLFTQELESELLSGRVQAGFRSVIVAEECTTEGLVRELEKLLEKHT